MLQKVVTWHTLVNIKESILGENSNFVDRNISQNTKFITVEWSSLEGKHFFRNS